MDTYIPARGRLTDTLRDITKQENLRMLQKLVDAFITH